MRLIIELYNLHTGAAGKLVNNVIKIFRSKFNKKLKKASSKETTSLTYIFEDNPKDKKGFRVLIDGTDEEIKKEHSIIEKEMGALEKKKPGQVGLTSLNMIGLHFNYYVEDDQ